MHSFELKMHQIYFWPGSAPDPAGGAYVGPPDTLVGWGGEPHTPPLDALGALNTHEFVS